MNGGWSMVQIPYSFFLCILYVFIVELFRAGRRARMISTMYIYVSDRYNSDKSDSVISDEIFGPLSKNNRNFSHRISNISDKFRSPQRSDISAFYVGMTFSGTYDS